MVLTAENVSNNQIISLWQECFGDDSEYVSSFLEGHPDKSRILTVQNGGELCSMLFLLECEAVVSGESFKSWYIYAACTAKKFRRRGLMAELLKFAEKYAVENGVSFIALVPAEKSLFDYYEKFGYKTCFYRGEKCLKASGEPDAVLKTDAASMEIFSIREKALKNSFHIRWNEKALDYALSEYSAAVSDKAYVLWYIEDSAIKIVEALSENQKNAEALLNKLMSENNISEIKYFVRAIL